MKKKLNIEFAGRPGDATDMAVHATVERYDGKVVASGTFLPASLRDLRADVPVGRLRDCLAELALIPGLSKIEVSDG